MLVMVAVWKDVWMVGWIEGLMDGQACGLIEQGKDCRTEARLDG